MSDPIRLTDERLAWLAARDYCTKRARSHRPAFWLFYVVGVIVTVGGVARMRRMGIDEKLADYAFAVDDVARRLTPEDRAKLRADNVLPAWFLPATEERFHLLRRHRLPTESTVMVGDTAEDGEAAADNRLEFIHASYGYGSVSVSCRSITCFSELWTALSVKKTAEKV